MELRAGLKQSEYAALYAKTSPAQMEEYRELLYKVGTRKAAEMVKANLRKNVTTQGWSTTTGAVFYDLRAPLYLLAPVVAPIRATTPRWGKVNAGYGVQPNWKVLTSFDAGNPATFPGVSEGNRNSYASVTEQNFSAPYATIGTDDFVTYEAESASEGYDDNLGTAHQVQMLRFLNLEEKTLLGGSGTGGANGNPLQLGTTNTPTVALSTIPSGGTYGLTTNNYYGGFCVALAYRAADAYRVNALAATLPSGGVAVQYTRNNADGSSDVINSSSAQVSAASNVVQVTANTQSVLFSVTPMAGAFAYAWFTQTQGTTFTPSATTAVLTAITSASAWVYYNSTTQPSGTQHPSVFSADWSTNQLDFDGLLTVASNTNYTSGWAPNNAYTADLHGAGLTNGGQVGAIAEIDAALQFIQQFTLTSPTAIYVSTDVVNTFRKAFMVGSTGAPNLMFFAPEGKSKAISIANGVADYFNVFSIDEGSFLPVIQHPYLPAGTILIDTTNLGFAYEHSRLGETRGVFVRRDTYGQEFARTSRKYPFGVYSEEVLGVKTPHLLGVIKSIGAFGQTKLF